MKTKSPNKRSTVSKTRAFLSLIVLALIVGVGLLAFHLKHNTTTERPANVTDPKQSHIDYSPTTAEDKKIAEDQKLQSNDAKSDTPATTLKAAISSATQDPSTKSVIVQTKLDGTGWQHCTLSLSKVGSTTVTSEADVLYQPAYSTCQGFSVSPSQFGSAGVWTVSLRVTNDTSTSAIVATPQTVTVAL